MKNADTTLLAAIMRARASSGELCCTIAYSGTLNAPPQAESAKRSISSRQPWTDDSTAAVSASPPAAEVADAKSQQKIEMPIAANGTCRGDTSPLSRRAHSIDPKP